MQVKNIDLLYSSKQKDILKSEIECRIAQIIDHGKFIIGPEVKELEGVLSVYCGVDNAVGCANGTDALTIALMAMGLEPDEVVFTPSFTYVATAEAISILRGKPYFVDVDSTFNICTEKLELAIIDAKKRGLKIKGIISVDLFGRSVDYKALNKIAKENNLFLISDSAQAFGAEYLGRKIGGFADITTTSFFPTKPLGCYGDGGMLFTNNYALASKMNSICFHGKGDDKYYHVRVGMNSRLDTIQAAVLLEKFKIFDGELKARQELAQFYNSELQDYLAVPNGFDASQSAWAVYSLLHPKRDKIIDKLNEANIPSNVYYRTPLHLQPAYRDDYKFQDLSNSEKFANEIFCLPMHAYIEKEERLYIVSVLKKIIQEI